MTGNRAHLSTPLFLALDVDTAEQALHLVQQTRGFVGGYKIGPRLCVRYGETLSREVARHGLLFIDNKYFDIPNTMTSAVRTSFEMGASFVTVHAQAGKEALSELAKLENELSQQRPFRILAVTVLTSFSQEGLPLTSSTPIGEQVMTLSRMVLDCGLSGIVCSPEEVSSLRQKFPQAYLVTPGVRMGNDERGDQKRVADPVSALKNGASALVVGRPIYASPEPAAAAKTYYEEIQKA